MSDNIYLNGSLSKYLKDLSAREMVPGGGSAAALSAASGAGLNLMVINYSMSKDEAEHSPSDEFVILKAKQSRILDKLEMLIDEDCRVFRSLMRSIGSGENEQDSYARAASVPCEICRLCCESIELSTFLVMYANKNLITDVACAAHTLKASFYAAELNVLINLRYITDTEFVDKTLNEIDQKKKMIDGIVDEVDARVREEIDRDPR